MGFAVAPDAWNEGGAIDATATLADYAVDELRFAKLLGQVYETNPASARVLETVGFAHGGTLRSHAYAGGKRVDIERYGLLATD